MQTLLVAVIVAACSLYAAWTLMPTALRRRIAIVLLALHPPPALARRLGRHAAEAAGCACDGCDRGSAAPTKANQRAASPAGSTQPLVFHPRPKKSGRR